MAAALPTTVVASEDARFCSHRGVDWREIRVRLDEIDDISEARGVSTITQQTAKNLFLWPGRSFLRKAFELPLALWIDLILPKRRVLEIYLNIAEWGPNGQFGAEAGGVAESASTERSPTRAGGASACRSLRDACRRPECAGLVCDSGRYWSREPEDRASFAASSSATFGFKSGTRIIEWAVSLRFRSWS